MPHMLSLARALFGAHTHTYKHTDIHTVTHTYTHSQPLLLHRHDVTYLLHIHTSLPRPRRHNSRMHFRLRHPAHYIHVHILSMCTCMYIVVIVDTTLACTSSSDIPHIICILHVYILSIYACM